MRKRLVFTTFASIAMGAVTAAQTLGQPIQSQERNPLAERTGSSISSAQNRPNQQPQATQSAGDQTSEVDQSPSSKLSFYQARHGDMRASELIGTEAYNRNNENVGEVVDLLIDQDKVLQAVVLSVGGFLGLGERNVAVDPGSVILTKQTAEAPGIVVNTTEDELKNAPELSELGGLVPGTKTRFGGTIGGN